MYDIPEQENIKEELAKTFVELEKARRKEAAIIARIDLLKQLCVHPEKVPVVHTGHRFSKCTTCGREW